MSKINLVRFLSFVLIIGTFALTARAQAAQLTYPVAKRVKHTDRRIVVDSHGWKLVGNLLAPRSKRSVPVVVLLNKAAGDRRVYERLATHLAENGFASLRIDLRGHGESINKGRFVPGDQASLSVIEGSDEDVSSVLRYLKTVSGLDSARIGIVGASYSAEQVALSARKRGYGRAYVALSPGSFSEESMLEIDRIGAAWLFIRSADEQSRSVRDLFQLLRQKSRTAEMMEVGGTEHATDILTAHPELAELIAVWFKYHLR